MAGLEDKALREASVWIARLQNEERSAGDEVAFDAWLRSTPEHAAAFDHVTSVWDLAGGAQGSRGKTDPSRRRLLIGFGASAAVGVGAVGWSVAAAAQTVRTSIGEQRRMTTPAGVQVLLDTDSVLVIDRRSSRGTARLKRGRASFNLADGGNDLFLVSSGAWKLAALAADFDVYADDLGAAVLVNRGRVVAVGQGGLRVSVDAGCRLGLAEDGRVRNPEPIDLKITGAWRNGRIVLENTRLADAAVSLNRYAQKPIIIADELADFRVSGGYRTGAPEDFARSVAVLADANIKVFRDRIEVSPKHAAS